MTANPWLERRVFNWAHRGGGREGPSNTLYAMQHAVDVGAHGLELDVHRTKDHHLVVAHDDDLAAMTGASGRISTSTLEELRTLDVAHNWVPGEVAVADAAPERYTLRNDGPGPRTPELGIPTLEEVLARFPGVPLNLEIKRWRGALPMAKALRNLGRDDIIVVSIRPWALWLFRLRAPSVKVAPSPVGLFAIWFASRVRLPLPFPGSVAIQPPLRRKGKVFADRRLIETAHKAGLAVHVWTVDERAEIEEALELGVDGIMTDCPSVLAAVLAERRVGWSVGG